MIHAQTCALLARAERAVAQARAIALERRRLVLEIKARNRRKPKAATPPASQHDAKCREEANRLYIMGDMARDPVARKLAFDLARAYEALAGKPPSTPKSGTVLMFPDRDQLRRQSPSRPAPGEPAHIYFLRRRRR